MNPKPFTFLTGVGVASALLLAAGPAGAADDAKQVAPPAAVAKYRKVETWGWRADLPADWKGWLNAKKNPARPYEGKWGYHSPRKNFRLRVKVRVSKGESWAARTKSTYEKLYKRMPDFGLLAANTKKLNGRDLFYILGRVNQKRVKAERDHLVFRMLVRFPSRNLRVVATFIAADERVDDVLKIVERFGDTFELVDPKSADAAVNSLGDASEEL